MKVGGSVSVADEVRLRIADFTIALQSQDPSLPLRLDAPTTRFIVQDSAPDVWIQASWKALSMQQQETLLFDSGGLWQLYRDNGLPSFHFSSPVFGAVPYKVARFSSDFAIGDVWLHRPYFTSEPAIAPLEYPLDELLMVHLLAQGQGLEVHACGVRDAQGQGYLLLGQSGAGKTTCAKLWQTEPGVTILSDDRIILRYLDNRFWMYGTPWHGEAGFACAEKAPLTQVAFLQQARHNAIRPQRPVASISRLVACSFLPFYHPAALDFTLQFCAEIVATLPCYEFAFLPHASALAWLQATMA